MRQATNATVDTLLHGMRRVAVALILLPPLLVAVACAVSNPVHEPPPVSPTPSPTMPPLPPAQADRSALYYLSADPLKGTTVGALGLRDGARHWSSLVPGMADAAAVGGGIVYVGEGSQGRPLPDEIPMQALSEAGGTLLWQSRFPASAASPLAVSGPLVLVQIDGIVPPPTPLPLPNAPEPTPAPPPPPNAIMALGSANGAPLWRLDVPGGIAQWAGVSNGVLYVVVSGLDPSSPLGGDLTAIDVRDGHVRWQVPLQSPLIPTSDPIESGGVLYFSEQYCDCRALIPSTMLAVRASDGRVLWQMTAPDGAVTTGVVVTGGMVSYSYTLAHGPGGGIVALHASDGSPAWQVSWSSVAPDGFAGGGGVLYAIAEASSGASSGLAVASFDAQTGALLFDRPVPRLPVQLDGTPGEGTLQEAGGTLYFVSPAMPVQTGATAQLVSVALALRASDGSLTWARALDGNVERSFFVVP